MITPSVIVVIIIVIIISPRLDDALFEHRFPRVTVRAYILYNIIIYTLRIMRFMLKPQFRFN